jgi:hypothetical protein
MSRFSSFSFPFYLFLLQERRTVPLKSGSITEYGAVIDVFVGIRARFGFLQRPDKPDAPANC